MFQLFICLSLLDQRLGDDDDDDVVRGEIANALGALNIYLL